MESFRKVIRGWLGKVLLVLFLTPLALVGIEGYFGGGNKADVATTVNGQEISKKDLEAQTEGFKAEVLKQAGGDESLLNMSVIQNKALDSLVSRTLLIQQAKKLGVSLSDGQIEQMIAQQPQFQKDGQFSKELYSNYLRSIGMTNQVFVENIRQDHALKMMLGMINDNALVSKIDTQQIFDLQTEKRDLYLTSIKLDEYKANVQVSNQEIADYYKKHPNQFKQPASVDVDFVHLTPAMFVDSSAPVSAEELQQAYNAYVLELNKTAKREVRQILITTDARTPEQAQKLAADVYAKIKGGMTFAQAAAQYSDDPVSKAKGGLLDVYAAGTFGEEFDQAVATSVAGQVTQPVKSKYGYHLIESSLLDGQKVAGLDEVKTEMTAAVHKNKSANIYTDKVNHLNESVVDNDALDVVPLEVKSSRIESVNGVRLSNQHPVLSDSSVKAKLFSDAVKNGDKNASASIQMANGDTVWIKVRQYHAAGVQPLNQATAQVKAKLIEQKASALAKAKIAAMLNDFKTLPAEQVLAKYPFKFEHAGEFDRSRGLQLKRSIMRAAFSVMPPKAGMWSVTTANLPGEMFVVAVAGIQKAPLASIPADEVTQQTKLYQGLSASRMLEDYAYYLKSQAKIK